MIKFRKEVILISIILGLLFLMGCKNSQVESPQVELTLNCDLKYDNTSNTEVVEKPCDNVEELETRIEKGFGLPPQKYTITSSSCSFERGGYYKITGKLSDKTLFSLFNDFGWCTPAGNDCGSSKCFSVVGNENQPQFLKIKESLCNSLDARSVQGHTFCVDVEKYDDTEAVKTACFSGSFIDKDQNSVRIGIKQKRDACTSSVEEIKFT